jgi:hypothetical protein
MKNTRILFFLSAIGLFSIGLGCESGGKGAVEEKGAVQLAFLESSQGLPAKGLWRQGIAFGDINADGHLDIVAPPPRNGANDYPAPVVWYGNGGGDWRQALLDVPGDLNFDYGGITIGDFDGDGVPGIGLGIHASGLMALKGAGGGKYVDFSDGLPAPQRFISRTVMAADFNGDGRADMAALSEGKFGGGTPDPKGVLICSRDKDAWTCTPVSDEKSLMDGLFGDAIAVGDVNGDGKRDIAIGSLAEQKNLIVWINEGEGRFRPFNEGLPTEKIYLSVALKDLNQDGRDDLVANISGFGQEGFVGLKAFLSREAGFEDISEGLPVKEPYTVIAADDLNNDGAVEIIGGTVAGGLKVFYQKEGRWEPAEVTGLPAEGMKLVCGIYCVDLDHDGYKDIVVNYASSQDDEAGGIRVFLNGPGKKGQTS